MTELRRTDRALDEMRADASGGKGLQTGLLDGNKLLDVLDDGVVLFDPASGRILDVNRGACSLLGRERSALLSASLWKLAGTPDDR